MAEPNFDEPGIFEIMHTTRSMRRLKPDPVPDALIRKILEAGISAPNGADMQRWRFLVIKDVYEGLREDKMAAEVRRSLPHLPVDTQRLSANGGS